MSRRQRPGVWVTNHLANPVMRPLLHGRLGRRLALIRYRGRRTGRSYELPVLYARDGTRIWILPAAPADKSWWRNLRGGAEVDLVVAGREVHGHAVVLEGTRQPDEVAEGLATYLRAFPRARLSTAAVLVRVDLEQ
jgi:hypothetical protein